MLGVATAGASGAIAATLLRQRTRGANLLAEAFPNFGYVKEESGPVIARTRALLAARRILNRADSFRPAVVPPSAPEAEVGFSMVETTVRRCGDSHAARRFQGR